MRPEHITMKQESPEGGMICGPLGFSDIRMILHEVIRNNEAGVDVKVKSLRRRGLYACSSGVGNGVVTPNESTIP